MFIRKTGPALRALAREMAERQEGDPVETNQDKPEKQPKKPLSFWPFKGSGNTKRRSG